ncbi:ROK family protein [Brevundimonas sp. NPDC092305]|uniref:ROK family protein n=1 Tax=Brevundimonas sp. NPDC092305 TaxID=3363957 RepID=UPI0037F84535
MSSVAGIELGGTRAAVTVGQGPQAHAAPIAVATTSPDTTVVALGDALERLQREGRGFTRIGVASFGPLGVDRDRPDWGRIGATPKPGWSHADVAGPLSRRFGVPVVIDTDVNAAAIGEGRWGAAVGCGSHVYVTVGTGIGMGVVVDGRPVHGALHPEAGHIRPRRLQGDGFAGRCPWHGDCLEGLVSGPALADRLGGAADDLEDAHPLFALTGAYLGEVLAAVALTASPQKIVIGGGVGRRPAVLAAARSAFSAAIAGYVPTMAPDGSDLLVGPGLGEHSGLFGALALALDAEGVLQSFA